MIVETKAAKVEKKELEIANIYNGIPSLALNIQVLIYLNIINLIL
jgi:hypothetical protein